MSLESALAGAEGYKFENEKTNLVAPPTLATTSIAHPDFRPNSWQLHTEED